MKSLLLLVAIASIALATPYEGYYGIKTGIKHRGNNVRLVCENGLCVLKTFQDKEIETPISEADITTETAIEEKRGDQPEINQEHDSNEDCDEHHEHEVDEDQHESDEHDEVHHESDEHEEDHHESDEHQEEKEADEHDEVHHESDEHQEEKEANDESPEEHIEIDERIDEQEKYTTMEMEESPKMIEIVQSDKDHDQHEDDDQYENHDQHEDHTLSVDLMPPHEESVWNMSNNENQNEEDSVIYKIPQDDRKYVKGVKGVKTPFRL